MKKSICLILAFAVFLIIACNNSEKDEKLNPYEGAWESYSSKYVYPDTTIERTDRVNPTVKLLTKKHFAFGRQAGDKKVVGGGGEYTYDGDTYTEHVKYHSGFKAGSVSSVDFKSKLNGDLWTIIYAVKNDTLQVDITETWKRIIE